MAAPAKALEDLQILALKEYLAPLSTYNQTSTDNSSLKGTDKRDALIEIEKKYQRIWYEETKVFEANAPSISEVPLDSVSADELWEKNPKWFGTMAYPYMNGRLQYVNTRTVHYVGVGHAFTMSKVEFATGWARMCGKNALFPQGYHCTGLPIKACADKLVKEVAMFGQEFDECPVEIEFEDQPAAPAVKAGKEDVTKFSAKKGKAAAKASKLKYQWQIMASLGIPKQEIHRFSDPQHWLSFFPPLCKQDMSNFGARIDWRREFVTTDANPYYDAFVRWQMNRLKELEKIKFGKRYTIYSIADGQPCMDHDRSEGEGVNPQDYTGIKMQVLELAPTAAEALKGKLPEGSKIYLVPATLRPETMYGQTACFVGPKIQYGIFRTVEKEYFLVTARAARNMSQQGIFEKDGTVDQAAEIQGADLIGTLVNAPLSQHSKGVRVLPMDTILEAKGTGVVSCVPSDSPDDFAMTTELSKKADFYGIQKEWADLEIVPIIKTPTSNLLAPALVKQMKINSPKDTKQLAEAKDLAYKEGFYQGEMLVGKYKGEKVEKAKPLVRSDMIAAGDAFAYAEPEGLVKSRSGDDCVVALLDQWYIDYGEDSWKESVLAHVENKDGKGLETYTSDTKNAFIGVLNWLRQWACARTYGLGSRVPWDPHYLVESLSDSTVYMSYYTVAHYLHSDIFGRTKGKGNIEVSQMIDQVWDYIFCRTQLTDEVLSQSRIPKETLQAMRREFEYFYPLDLRVSGKDLVPNHLSFCLYIHAALFKQEHWPRRIRSNGHLLLNSEKMSKSTGNFMTLDEFVKKYGADAARIALADAGDSIADANCSEDVADASVIKLANLKEFCEGIVKDQDSLRTGEPNDFQDALFDNEMHHLVREAKRHYEATSYKLALVSAFYDFVNARDVYREACSAAGIPMHKDIIFKFIKLQALIIATIAPHWAEYIYLEVLQEKKSVQLTTYPVVPAPNPALSAARAYVLSTQSSITSAEASQLKKLARGKQATFDPKRPKKATIYMTEAFPTWQAKYVDLLGEVWDPATRTGKVDDKELNGRVAKMGEMKKAMPFVQGLKRRLKTGEPAEIVLSRKLAFDEKKTLIHMVPGLKRAAGLTDVSIVVVQEGSTKGVSILDGNKEVEVANTQVAEGALPGQPTFFFENA